MSAIKVLLVDDHQLFRTGLRQLLERHPAVSIVGEASTGRAALDEVASRNPDIVLLDISLPEMNGIEVTRRLTHDHPEVRVLIVSMHSDHRYVTEALRAGAKGYLLKDSSPDEMLRAIQRVLNGQYYLSPHINEQVISDFVQQSRSDDSSAYSILSAREREVLQLLAEGKSTKQTAELLNVSVKTVETHRMHIMDKLQIHTLPELTRYALKEGLTSLS